MACACTGGQVWASVPSLCNGEGPGGLPAQSPVNSQDHALVTPPGALVLLMLPQLQPQTPLLPPTPHLEPFLPVSCTLLLSHVNPLLYIPGPARGHLTDQVPTKQLPPHQQSLIRASSPCPGPPRGPLGLLEPCFPGGDSETQVICLELGAGGLGDRAAEPRSKEQPMATGDSTVQVLRQ